MRPTQLNFRSPNERTGDYISAEVNKEGKRYDITAEKRMNPKGTNLPRE
jgi:murein tripeptide amidase MpaA